MNIFILYLYLYSYLYLFLDTFEWAHVITLIVIFNSPRIKTCRNTFESYRGVELRSSGKQYWNRRMNRFVAKKQLEEDFTWNVSWKFHKVRLIYLPNVSRTRYAVSAGKNPCVETLTPGYVPFFFPAATAEDRVTYRRSRNSVAV